MDIIFLIFACFYISKRAKAKGLEPKPWVLRLIGIYILFELIGGFISMMITKNNLTMAAIFGFFCALGGFLLVKYKLDNTPENKTEI